MRKLKRKSVLAIIAVITLLMGNVAYAGEIDTTEEAEEVEEYSMNAAAPGVSYYTHVQNVGNQAAVTNGAVSGTSGKSYRLEGIWIHHGENQ